MKTHAIILAAAAALLAAGAIRAEDLLAVRVGEQDTCRLTGVTSIEPIGKGEAATVRFDLAKLPAAAVRRAVLRMWVAAEGPLGRAFGMGRWNDPTFGGFGVWQVGGPAEPLARSFPFAYTSFACHEWDVTAAVQAWAKDAKANQGLRTDFPLPAAGFQPAWQRPYLEVMLAAANPEPPKQPAGVKAFCRSGQVFVTFEQLPDGGAFFDSTYRLYIHDRPITAANLDQATLAGEAHRLSQLNYRRSAFSRDGRGSYAGYQHLNYYLGVTKTEDMTQQQFLDAQRAKIPPRYNFVIDDTWPQRIEEGKWLTDATVLGPGFRELKGPELTDDSGLIVYTVRRPGTVYVAVTHVLEGNENRRDFTAANAPVAPLDVKVETPRPVLQAAFNRIDPGYPHQKSQVREYVFWGGGDDGLHCEAGTPFFFRINVPRSFVNLDRPRPAEWLSIAPWWSHGAYSVTVDGIYIPPTRRAPFPPVRVPFSSGGWRAAAEFYQAGRTPSAEPRLWRDDSRVPDFYGYLDRMNTGQDPRGATVRPYFENLALRELDYFFAAFPQADRDRVVVTGEGTALLLAVHHPEAFACCEAAQEEIWTPPNQRGRQWPMVGRPEWELKNELGHGVWDWNDPVWLAHKFPRQAWPFISQCQSPNYARSDQTHWGNCGYPDYYLAMAADRRGGGWWWCDIGDAPNAKSMNIARNEAYLAFTGCNFAETPVQEWKLEPRGTLNGYLEWHRPGKPFAPPRRPGNPPAPQTALPLAMVDTADRFEVAVRIGDEGLLLNGQSVPPTTAQFGACTITPWRLQKFAVAVGGKYAWENRRVATGQALQSGVVTADDRGLVTVPGFLVDRDWSGNKLILRPAGNGPPAAPQTDQKVGELAYAEYVRRCEHPVLYPTVRPPTASFTPAEFTVPRANNPDGSLTFKGGSFGESYDTIVLIEKPGPYVISVRARGTFGGAWPLLTLSLGGKYGSRLGTHVIDSEDYAAYRWYANLPAGKLRVRLTTNADYYATPVLPALNDKRLQIAELTFAAVDEAKAATTPAELRIAPRQISVPVGKPIVMGAGVLNALGQPMQSWVKWSCDGAKISADGRLTATKPGPITVTAEAAGLRTTVPLRAEEAFVDDFNVGGNVLVGWTCFELDDKSARWYPPAAGHTFLTSLWQHTQAASSVLLWDHGAALTDASIQADVFLTPRGKGEPLKLGNGVVHGLVVRARGRDDHYRLEIRRTDAGSIARLVKRVGGVETVLAEADKPPALAAFDWRTNPMCPGWHDMSPLHAGERGIDQWRMDHMKLQAAGDTLRAWINGKEVFPGGVKDAALKAGTAGLYCVNQTIFDNVEIR